MFSCKQKLRHSASIFHYHLLGYVCCFTNCSKWNSTNFSTNLWYLVCHCVDLYIVSGYQWALLLYQWNSKTPWGQMPVLWGLCLVNGFFLLQCSLSLNVNKQEQESSSGYYSSVYKDWFKFFFCCPNQKEKSLLKTRFPVLWRRCSPGWWTVIQSTLPVEKQ